MDVVFGHRRELEVHDVRQGLDIQTSSSDVGGHQHLCLALLEGRQCAHALRLALVAVDRAGADAVLDQLFGEPVGATLGAREDQHLTEALAAHHVGKQVALAGLVDGVHQLTDRRGCGIARCDVDRLGIAQHVIGQATDRRREGRAEEERLALRRELLDDLLDVVDEAHVEHAVSLIQHEHLDRTEVDRPLSHVVEQAARRGHHDLRPLAQRAHLAVHAHAPVDSDRADGLAAPVGPHTLLHLEGELARGNHHQGANTPLTGLASVAQAVEHG